MLGSFGDYTLLETLGEGDMGTTYKAQRNDESPVALKILDKIDTSSEMKRGAAMDVLEFAQSLDNPRLHPILEILEAPPGSDYIGVVTPYLSVGSIWSNFQKGNVIPKKHAFKLIANVASAIGFLHSQDIAHGGLKPGNVLINGEGEAVVTDLTMAHIRDMGFVPDRPTDQHLFFALPEREYHAAPEQGADIYALGVIAYLLLAGRMPFTERDWEARGIIPHEGLPPAVAAVLRKAINPQMRHRYHGLNDFMLALKDATAGKVDRETERLFGVNAPPPGPDDETS